MVTIANIKLVCLRSGQTYGAGQVPATDFPHRSAPLRDMLETALSTRRPAAFPETRHDWSCEAANHGGALTLRICSPRGPVVTLGVATRTTHGRPLWRMLTALVPGQGLAAGTDAPTRLWCAWVWHEQHPSEEDQSLLMTSAYILAATWAAQKHQWSRIYASRCRQHLRVEPAGQATTP